jgi:hemerythrin-like domain-containing protein
MPTTRSKRGGVERACAALAVHACIEEEIFYPAVQRLLQDGILGEEALVEHSAAKDLIASLETLDPGDRFYDATFVVLTEYVKHHVKEEETEMFPQVKRANLDLQDLGRADEGA